MNPQTEAALIAGFISLVGVLVSLIIATRNSRAIKAQAILIESLKETRESAARIRAFGTEIERLRAQCWLLNSQAFLIKNSAHRPDKFTAAILEKAMITKAFEKYWTNWADTKSDISSTEVEVMQAMRHESRHLAHDVDRTASHLAKLLKSDLAHPDRLSTAESLTELSSALLKHLDRIYQMVTGEQAKKLSEMAAASDA